MSALTEQNSQRYIINAVRENGVVEVTGVFLRSAFAGKAMLTEWLLKQQLTAQMLAGVSGTHSDNWRISKVASTN